MATKKVETDADEDFEIDYGRTPSVVRRTAYFLVGLVTSLLPVYLYVGVLDLNFAEAQITVFAGSLVGAGLLSLAYHNIFFSKRVNVSANNSAPTKSMFKRNADAYNAAVDQYESMCTLAAICWSFFYNNLIFLALVVVFGVYVLASKIQQEANYVVATVGAAGFTYYNSRKAMQAIGEL